MSKHIRQVTVAELDVLLPLVEQFYHQFNYPFDLNQQTAVIQRFMNSSHLGSIWLIDYKEETIGYVALTYGFTFGYGGRDAYIDEFYIINSYRNQGLGSWVLDAIKQEIIRIGLVALNLQIESNNTRAKKLYKRSGFQDLKRNTLTWFVNIETP